MAMANNKTQCFTSSEESKLTDWEQNTITVAAGNGYGEKLNQLNSPAGIFIDKNKNMLIADYFNHRIVEWKYNAKEGQIIAGAGGNGQGDQLNQLNYPTFIFIDEEQSVYVSDRSNHRVTKWRKDAKEGKVVAGGNGEGGNLSQLFKPQGIIVDHLSQIYVADWGNNRVMRWCKEKRTGEIIVGGFGSGNDTNQLNGPMGLCFDSEGNLYVADSGNHRIEKSFWFSFLQD
ncbi:unnamed protein product [Adineta steineri]|uniref:Uncharacterized protein n=1 Tax=Adineta steineri TaxID=433720 RepID=A0A819R405_9BILA|nr:unnamed protein product [Adineta steineri]